MNIKDMHVAFIMELDKAMLSGLPSFDVSQIDYFLNNAYLMKINQKLTGNNVLKQAFEMSPKRISDLQKLVTNVVIIGSKSEVHSLNEISFNLDNVNDFMYPVSSVIRLNDTSFNPTIFSNHENIDNLRSSDINKPWIPSPIAIYEDNKVLVYVDPDNINEIDFKTYPKLILTYIKRPLRLDFNSTSGPSFKPEIEEHVIPEIVSLAADLAIENIESQRVQTHPNITNNKE